MSFGDTWKNAASENIEPPRGTYKIKIVPGGNAFTSQKGDDCCKLNLEITEGDLKGAKFEHFMWFGHEVGARINREALLAYGLDDPEGIETIDDLDDRLVQLTGRTAEVGVSFKDGRMNINVNGSRSPNGTPSDIPTTQESFEPKPAASFAAAAGGADDSSDVPF